MKRPSILAFLIMATRAWGCSCGGEWPSVKQAWQDAPVVFLGTVELADPDLPGIEVQFETQLVRIRVNEAFKGVSQGQIIELNQNGTDCDAKFRTGERFVFYFHRDLKSGRLFFPWCSRVLGNPASGGDDLLFLHGLPNSAKGTRLSGEVQNYEDGPHEFRRVSGVPNVKVEISGPGGFERNTTTNADGAYEVYGLKPGVYSVHIEVPSELKLRFSTIEGSARVLDHESSVELRSGEAPSVNFVLQADTRLSGRVLDADDTPHSGLCFVLEPVETPAETLEFACSKEDGKFEVEHLPPGRYRLLAHQDFDSPPYKSRSTLYYPGVRDRSQARIVSVETGKHADGLVWRLPSGELRRDFSGKVSFADGVPVTPGSVTFTSAEGGYTETTSIDADGSFHLSVVAGMTGQLQAEFLIPTFQLTQCPQLTADPSRKGFFRFVNSNPIPVSAGEDQEGMKIEMPTASCQSVRAR